MMLLLGAVYGDIIGSYYEARCTKNYGFEFNRDSKFTDDSVLIAAVCQAVTTDPSEISVMKLRRRAKEYGAQYRRYYSLFPNAGFGNMFKAWASDPGAKNCRSFGNGGAMRAIPIGYAYESMKQTMLQAKASCLSTHNSREAIKAARAVAAAVFLARQNESKENIRLFLEKSFGYDLSVPIESIRSSHVFDSRSSYSVPPAIICFLQSKDYESAVRNAVSLGGDADTEGCIAGGIAEAYYKHIPDHIRCFCDPKIDISIKNAVRAFEKKFCKNSEGL